MSGLRSDFIEVVAAAVADHAGLTRDAEFEVLDGSTSLGWLSVSNGGVAPIGEPSGDVLSVRIPLTSEVIARWLADEADLAVSYMRGDLKPEGDTGALVVALELLNDPAVRIAVAG